MRSPATRHRPRPDGLLLLDLDQTASRLGRHVIWVRRAIRAGALPAVRIGRSLRVRLPDLLAYIDRSVVTPGSPPAPSVPRRGAVAS